MRAHRIVMVEHDQIVTLAPPPGKGPSGGDNGGSTAQTTPYGITRVGGPVDGSGLTARVLGTGINLDHPDLNVNT